MQKGKMREKKENKNKNFVNFDTKINFDSKVYLVLSFKFSNKFIFCFTLLKVISSIFEGNPIFNTMA